MRALRRSVGLFLALSFALFLFASAAPTWAADKPTGEVKGKITIQNDKAPEVKGKGTVQTFDIGALLGNKSVDSCSGSCNCDVCGCYGTLSCCEAGCGGCFLVACGII